MVSTSSVGIIIVIVDSERSKSRHHQATKGAQYLLCGVMVHIFVTGAAAARAVPVTQYADGSSEQEVRNGDGKYEVPQGAIP